MAAAAGTVGLSDYGGDFEVGLGEEVLQRGDSEVRSAAEEEAQWVQSEVEVYVEILPDRSRNLRSLGSG